MLAPCSVIVPSFCQVLPSLTVVVIPPVPPSSVSVAPLGVRTRLPALRVRPRLPLVAAIAPRKTTSWPAVSVAVAAPVVLMPPLAPMSMSESAPLALKVTFPPAVTGALMLMLLPLVLPLCCKFTLAAIMLSTTRFPLCAPVTPVPTVSVTVPVPALSVVPAAIVMPPALESLFAACAAGSLAVTVKLPLSVVIFELSTMLRPACIVIAPPAPPAEVVIGDDAASMISLLACKTTLEPVLVIAVIDAGVIV